MVWLRCHDTLFTDIDSFILWGFTLWRVTVFPFYKCRHKEVKHTCRGCSAILCSHQHLNPTCCKSKARALLLPTPDGLPQTNAPALELTYLIHIQSPADLHFRTGDGLVTKLCQTLVTPWMAAHQDPLSMRLSWQKYWSGLPFPSPGDIANPGIKPKSPCISRIADGFFTTEPQGKPI